MQSSAADGPSWAQWVRSSFAIIVMAAACTVVIGTLPLLNGFFAGHLRLDWRDLGWLGSIAQTGTLTGTLLGYGLIGRGALLGGLRFGSACATLAWVIAATATSSSELAVGRVLTSIGLGCAFSIGCYSIARMPLPARGFSIMSGVQVLFGSAHAAVLPWLQAHFGYTFAVASIAVWFVLILILTPWYSTSAFVVSVSQQSTVRRARHAGVGLLLSLIAFQMSAATFWGYSERVATASGLSPESIASAVSLGNLGGIPAAILGAWAGERFGYLPILLLATLAAAGGQIEMAHAMSAAPYLVGQLVFNFGWMLGVSYYLALLARRAADPGLIRAAPVALVVAGALGPLSIALFSRHDNATMLLVMSVSLAVVALLPAIFQINPSVDLPPRAER